MGLFSDKCEHCGFRIKKGARFCSKCGKPGERGDTTCGACGAEVALISKFCWKCGADLNTMQAPNIISHRWIRDINDFAVRIDDVDVPGLLTKGLIIEHGTKAILFQRGKYVGELKEGVKDVGGLLSRINNFNTNVPASVILMDAGDITQDIEVTNILTQDNIPVNVKFRISLQVVDPDSFYLNLFKTKKKFTLVELRESLSFELANAIATLVAGYNTEDLFGNPQLRQSIESDITKLLEDILNRVGLKIVQLRLIQFTSEEYERIRRERGKTKLAEAVIEIREDRIKLQKRLRDSLTQEKMDSFKSEKDLEEYIRQTEHELGIKEVVRQDEMQTLKERFVFNKEKEGILRRIEIQGIEDDAERQRAMDNLLAGEERKNITQREELNRRLGVAKNELEIKKIQLEMEQLENEQDFIEAQKGLQLLERTQDVALKKKEREQELEREKIEAYSKASTEALLAILDGPQAERLKALEEYRLRTNLTPEQLLALTAEKSPEAARALAEKYKAESKITEERLKDMEERIKDQKEMADRLERMAKEAMTQMGAVAGEKVKTPEQPQTIVTGGVGQPVVIGAGGISPGQKRTCPKCGISLEPQALFCPDCGHKIK